jgi:anti-sigma regulatory factor (Ser/Thr protein kinase)
MALSFQGDIPAALYRIGLAAYLNLPDPPQSKQEDAGSMIPVTQVRTEEQAGDILTDVIPLLHASRSQADAVHYIISELVRNVLEHSRSATGAFISARYDHTTQRITLGVVDAGCGMRASIRRSHNVPDDQSAVLLALRPGVTGTTPRIGGTYDNAGLGLFYTKAIASSSGGDFLATSGEAQFHLASQGTISGAIHVDPLSDPQSALLPGNLPSGTAVGVDFFMRQTESFASVLRQIGEIASSDIRRAKREQERLRYRKARFE